MVNQIIPFMEFVVEDNTSSEYLPIPVADFPACFVDFFDHTGEYLQPSAGYGFRSPFASIVGGDKRMTTPGSQYLGEKPVFDGVVLGAIRGIVHHDNPQPDSVGERNEVLFDDVVETGIGAATVTKNDKHFGIGIEMAEMLVPAGFDVVADKLGSIVAGADGEISCVVSDVVDSVRDNGPIGESGEVVVKGLWGCCAEYGPLALEIADKFLFLGVDADNRNVGLDTHPLNGADFLKLLVPTLDFAHRDILAERPRLESALLDEPTDVVFGNVCSAVEKLPSDSGSVDVELYRALVHRVTCHMLGHYFHKALPPFQMLGYFVFSPASWLADSAFSGTRSLPKFANSLANRLRGNFEKLAQRLYGKAVVPDRLACNKKPSLPFIECHKECFFLFFKIYWRFLLQLCKSLEFNYKDTKISPVICCLEC